MGGSLNLPGIGIDLRVFTDSLPDAIVILGADRTVAYANAKAERLLGYAPGETCGLSVDEFVPVRMSGAYAANPPLPSEPSWERSGNLLDRIAVRKDGREIVIEVSISPLATTAGIFAILAIRDRTDCARVDQNAMKILEAVPEATVLTRADGTIAFANGHVQELFDYTREELIGQSVEILVPDRLRMRHVGLRATYFAAPRARSMSAGMPLFGRRRDGSEFPAEISLSPLVTEDGILALAVVRDISERQRAAGQQARLLLAEEALRVRDEFISTASHELRTPLTSLQLRSDALNRLAPKLSDAARVDPILENMLRKVEGIGSSTARIAALITNLLDISRITSGKLELQPELVDLSVIARNVVDECRDEAAIAGSLIRLDAARAVTGEWDEARLEQVFVNLVSNAIKYGSRTAIDVSVTQPTEKTARIIVRDHGIGIAMEDQSRVFQRFERAVSSRNYSGFGLGLWIVQRIVEAHGGEIHVESAPGLGATFTVDLPRKSPGAR